jgi:hypothetical protein
MNKCFLQFLFIVCFVVPKARGAAADTAKAHKLQPPVEKFYVGNAFDGPIFSLANIETTSAGGAKTSNLSVLRFSWFFNFGFTFNFNFSRHIGAFTGIDVKNIGYIVEDNDASTTKRRTYNVGIPVGVKIGNMARKKGYIFFGGGVDAPVNYKEKNFIIRAQKTKFNEWFSQRTPEVMPYVFIGTVICRGLSVKAQYYPNNFFNINYKAPNGSQPYLNTNVHLYFLSLGAVMRYGKRDLVKKHITDLKMM